MNEGELRAMKKFSAKILCSALAWVVTISPVFACTAAPKADVSKPAPNQNSSTYCECIIASSEKAPEPTAPEQDASQTRAKCGSNKPTLKPETKPNPEPVKPEKCKPATPVKPEVSKPSHNKPSHNKPIGGDESTQNTFVIDNFKVIQATLQKLGIQPEELEGMIKEGKKLPEVLELKNIPVAKFKKVLLKQYYAAINEGVENKQITKEEAKMLRSAIKEKVMSWLQTK